MSSPTLAIRALDLLGSEWTKVRSVRSTFWSLLVAVVTPIAVSAAGSSDGHPVPSRTRSEPVDQSPAIACTVGTCAGKASKTPSAVSV